MNIRFSQREQQPADVSQGMKVPYTPGRRAVASWRWWIILALVASPFFYLLYQLVLPLVVVTAPGVVVLDKETLVAVTESVVDRVLVQPGERVRRGQEVARLSAPKLEQQIETVETMLEPVSGSLAGPKRLALYRQQELHAARAVAHQEQRLAVVARLRAQGAATEAEVNAIRSQLDAARHVLVQAQLERTEAEGQAAVPSSPATGAPLSREQLQRQLPLLQAQRQQLTLVADGDGTVLEILAERGSVLDAGAGVLVIGRQERPHVEAYMRPEQVKWVSAGTRATVTVAGDLSLEATVRDAPGQTRRLPAELSSAIGSREMMVLVTLDPVKPLPVQQAIEGLPVRVRFHRAW